MSEHPHAAHIVPKSTYYLIFLALMIGTGLTWWIATIDLGAMNNVIMLTIAVTKATLVVLFFMHVKYSNRLTWVVVAGGLFWLGIMITMTMADYLTRSWQQFGSV
jgi:cytochrome c oxidase subunit IV